MFEQQYDEEMAAEIRRLEGKRRAEDAGHPEWDNACACGCRIPLERERCENCVGGPVGKGEPR